MIVVLGADGLLGSHLVRRFPTDTIGFSHHDLDIRDQEAVSDALYRCLPDAVINCAGITNRNARDLTDYYGVNDTAPHSISRLGDQLGFKFIQVSTDCVFMQTMGHYTELDEPDSTSVYGITKHGGEVSRPPHLTVRTSFVGWPDPKGRGLLAWLHSHQGQRIQGYKNYHWNGLTTTVLADALYELAYSSVCGCRHLFGETLSKYDVLKIVANRYKWDVDIEPVDYPVVNATLGTVFDDWQEFVPVTDFTEQVDMMFRARDYA